MLDTLPSHPIPLPLILPCPRRAAPFAQLAAALAKPVPVAEFLTLGAFSVNVKEALLGVVGAPLPDALRANWVQAVQLLVDRYETCPQNATGLVDGIAVMIGGLSAEAEEATLQVLGGGRAGLIRTKTDAEGGAGGGGRCIGSGGGTPPPPPGCPAYAQPLSPSRQRQLQWHL